MASHRNERSAGDIPAAVAQQAIEWMLELQAHPESASVRSAWAQWRNDHPTHDLAWQRVESFQGRLGRLSAAPGAAHSALTAKGLARRGHAVKLLMLLVFGSSVVWSIDEKKNVRRWFADLSSDVGQQRQVTLEDGTRLVLNTNTIVDLHFSARERRLHLLEGEVYVATAHDSSRPFLVETETGTAHALGTRFTVRTFESQSHVDVFEGAVRVTCARSPGSSVVLQAGQGVRFRSTNLDTPMTVREDANSWLNGMLVAHSMRLDDFLTELSRYSRQTLSCDPAVAGLRVSGSYPVADISRILDALSATLNLKVESVTRFWGLQTTRIRLASRT